MWAFGAGFVHTLQRTSRVERLFLLTLGANVILLLLGPRVVPAALDSVDAWGTMLATVGMQVALALLALFGPVSFAKYPAIMPISLGLGALFACCYLGILVCEIAGYQLSFDTGPGTIYAIFVGIALLAGALASLRTRRLRDAVVASCWALVIGTALWSLGMLLLNYALWGSAPWFQFWKGDGALDDFRRSGGGDLALFLLQDLQGALFFHPMLSVVIGAIGGVVSSVVALLPIAAWRRLHRSALSRA